MQLVRYDPFTEMLSLQREMDRMFNRIGKSPASRPDMSVDWMPEIDVKTTDNEMVVKADVPGMNEQDIDIEVNNGMLTISGERQSESKKDEGGWIIKERSHGTFQRTLALPDGVMEEDITADYNNGMLEVHVPMSQTAMKPHSRHIAIGGNGERKLAMSQPESRSTTMSTE